MKKRILSLLLCLMLCLSLMPLNVFAADIASGTGWNLSDDGVLHITGAVPAEGFGLTDEQKLQVVSVVTTSGASISNGKMLFRSYDNMTSADLSNLDTSSVTDMSDMFWGCDSLTSLDVSGFDTSNVTTMYGMFDYCSELTSLDVSGFDTSKVTKMNGMFSGCGKLASLDVSGFDTSKVTVMNSMFYGCSGLTSLDVSGFDTSKVTSMNGMFTNCNKLASLDVSSFDTSMVTDMYGLFKGCHDLTSLDLSGFNTSSVTDMSEMFRDCSGLTSLDVSSFDTSSVKYMTNMFYGCSSLTSLDVSGFDTSKVIFMLFMFQDCSSLTSLDISGFDTSSVPDINNNLYNMLAGCSSLTSLGIRPDILFVNANRIIEIRSPWQKKGSTDTYSSADELKAITENIVLIEPTTCYKVTFDMNGHGDQITEQDIEECSKATKPEDPTTEGWTFEGWYADADFSVAFDFNSAITADTTIYAKWSKNKYSVLFIMNIMAGTDAGGTATVSPAGPVEAGTVITLTAVPDEGYHFCGTWSEFGIVTGIVFDGNTFIMPEADVAVTTHFEKNKYDVVFDMNEHGESIAAQKVEYKDKATKPADPSAEGWTFDGWYVDATFSEAFDFDAAITADTTVYAKWTENDTTPTEPTDPSVPPTGDNSNMLLWIALLFISGSILVGTTVYKKKKYNVD